jgi:hypothetical protein
VSLCATPPASLPLFYSWIGPASLIPFLRLAATSTTHRSLSLPGLLPPGPRRAMEEPPPGSSKAAAARAPRVVGVLAGLLERAAERGDTATPTLADSAFRGRALPGIPVRRYAERIYRYAGCSPACYVLAYVYLDRLARGQCDAGAGEDEDEDEAAVVGIDSYTVHRLLITSVLVAAKFMDDRYVTYVYLSINLS